MGSLTNRATNHHVTVLGAGIVGVCCALHLQRKGFRVTVVDRLPPGEAASFGNACMITDSSIVPLATPGIAIDGLKMLLGREGPLFISPAYSLKALPWMWRFLHAGNQPRVKQSAAALADLLRGALAEHLELADNTPAVRWISDDPTLYLYTDESEYKKDSYGWNIKRELGVCFETLDGKTLHELEPALSERFQFAVRALDHGKAVNPSKLTKAYAEWLEHGGGKFLQREVRDIEIINEQAANLITDQDPLPLDILVIAAGAWSAHWSKRLGDKIPLEAEGGYHVTVQDPSVSFQHCLMHSKAKLALADMEQGIRIAGMAEFAGIRTDTKPARTALLLKHLHEILPGINTERYTEWRGNRPSLPDSLPVIGPATRFKDVYYAFGNQHVGLSSGPKTGKLIAQLIAGEPTDIDVNPFRADRF